MRFILTLLLVFGCSNLEHIRPQLSTEIDYQKDLKMRVKIWNGKKWVNEKSINGMGVIQESQGYKIKIEPPGKADMITVLSCHREWKTPNPKRHGGWFSKRYYEFEIWPTKEHEALKTCPFDAGVYEKKEGLIMVLKLSPDLKSPFIRSIISVKVGLVKAIELLR